MPTYLETMTVNLQELVISPQVVTKAKACFLDYLAASLAASGGVVAQAGQAKLAYFGTGELPILASKLKSSIIGSAFYHSLIATAEDLDDAHRYASGLHMSATTFPIILALGQGVSGKKFIEAAVFGYEISSRLVRATDSGLRQHGFHSTGAAGVFGAAITAACLLGLDRQQQIHALSIAASGAGGLFSFLPEGALVRHLHGAFACVNGLSSALMAKVGFTGASQALEGYGAGHQDGYLNAYAGTWDESFILEPTTSPEILNAYHKLHATCGHAFPAITALQALRGKISKLERITAIRIYGYKASADLQNKVVDTVTKAKFSLPIIAGIVLHTGGASQADMCLEQILSEPVQNLANLVQVFEDPELSRKFPALRAARVEIDLEGEILVQEVDAPYGMPENPVKFQDLEQKFLGLAQGVLGMQQAQEILQQIANLENLNSLDPLWALLVKK